ncbi:hypothetical protein N7G274_009720 [Stereocaulon virgatum]|uniref:Uncharacterized protein n=1 Tax=Stereocaulon virgatum TaxID=373712 RepID=A0ABR3ZZU3_9LECA
MLALTAAGADDKVYDGNRKMAQLGEALIELLLAENAFTAGCSRADVSNKITSAAAKRHREEVAKATGIARFIRCNPRQGGSPPSPVVLSLAVSAIVCACWLDSDRNNAVAREIIWRLGIAIPEQETCLDPRRLPIQQQPPLLTDGQTPSVLSNQQPNCSGGNNGYLTIFREMIADEFQDSSEAREIAESHGAEGLDPTEVMSQELSENVVGWETPGQDVASEIQFDSMFQPTSPSLAKRKTEFYYSNNQDLPFESVTQVDDGHRSHGSHDFRMNEDGNTDTAEPEDIGMHACLDKRQNEHSDCDAGPHQVVARKISLGVSSRPKGVHATTSTPLSRSRKRESFTRPKSGFDPMRAAPKRSGAVGAEKQNITKANSKSKTTGGGPLLKNGTACLEAYTSQYRTRYERLALPCPGDFVDSEKTKHRLASLGLQKHANVLRVFSLTIAGYESVVGLKEILRAYRDPDVGSPQIAREVSNSKRLETIQRLGGKEAYLNLLKKCHIHSLFTDNIDPCCNSNDNFIVSTAKSVATRASGELGNPRYSAESRITKAIMKEVYPEVHTDSTDYSKKYREISGLRRCGRRLDVLVSHFGKGIFGLLPLAQDDSSPGLIGKITDAMISCLRDDEFRNLVCVLDQHEGVLLRDLGNAATQIVDGVFHRTIDASTRFVIETVESEQIMDSPKGSSRLRKLLSRVPTSLQSVAEGLC